MWKVFYSSKSIGLYEGTLKEEDDQIMAALTKVFFSITLAASLTLSLIPQITGPEPADENEWHIYTVDSDGRTGGWASIAVDIYNIPHISYHTWENSLKYARWNGTIGDITLWHIETVAWSRIQTGPCTSIVLDSKGNPHISYIHGPYYLLNYSKWTGSKWIHEPLDLYGWYGGGTSMALDRDDNPHISYLWVNWSTNDHDLRYIRWNGTSWIIETIDYMGSVGVTSSIALDSNDNPHISYYDGTNKDLKYAKWSGNYWAIETVDSIGDVGMWTSIVLDSSDNPHISYYDYRNKDLKYARWTGSTWDIETVDSNGYVGAYTSLDIDSNDNPHIGYYDYTNHDLKYATKAKLALKRPPVADANGPYHGNEGSPIELNASGSYDPDGDTLQYRWDLNNDGIWDTGWSSSPYLDYTWPDDYSGEVAVEVSDGENADTDTATVVVNNVAPTAELRILPIHVNMSLRIAGEKWHDVSIELYGDNVLVAQGNLTRYPESPNDHMLGLGYLEANVSREYSAIVRYTPENDPINGQPNGANPCWVILRFNDGEEVRIHHTFNVQHPETYIWEVDLTRAIFLRGITFEATAYDPGADDLTFQWDFGDGTSVTSFYPNDDDIFPVVITEAITHAFPGRGIHTVTLTVEDDDGGVGVASISIVIP